MKKDILIVTAMKMELPSISGAVVTGFGKEKTKKTMQKILETRNPSLVILTGLAGAAASDLKIGDIFIPEKIIDYENRKMYEININIEKNGILVTVPKIFGRRDKYRLKEIIPDAGCVDMEASGVAEVLTPLGIPFLCVKAVSDELDFDFNDKVLLGNNIKKAIKNSNEYLSRFYQDVASLI